MAEQQYVIEWVDGLLVRTQVDEAGVRSKEYVARLHWCDTHSEPVWVYGDGSFGCPYDDVVEVVTEHEIKRFPHVLAEIQVSPVILTEDEVRACRVMAADFASRWEKVSSEFLPNSAILAGLFRDIERKMNEVAK